MNSPVVTGRVMQREALAEGLLAYRCGESGGIYIPADSYWRWLSRSTERLPQLPMPSEEVPKEESSGRTLVCPESGMLMTRYRVGHGFGFAIDRSPSGGIWLDAGEWEALRNRQFHDELHLVFTAPWQREIRRLEWVEAEKLRYEERLGAALVSRIDALRRELAEHPDREMALALINRPLGD
ncbi:hypothetical protein ACFQY0_05770 [Haloferula chungangensis]|uniref:HNH endonuclease n=1 Tax=Haloferula chungangensis TaxID=1048331 RepID=A0ABW2L6A0_9BACT